MEKGTTSLKPVSNKVYKDIAKIQWHWYKGSE